MSRNSVRHQPQLDRMHDLNNGGFLAHRNLMENEDETEPKVRASETDNTSELYRAGREGHPSGYKKAVFGRRKDQDRAGRPERGIQHR